MNTLYKSVTTFDIMMKMNVANLTHSDAIRMVVINRFGGWYSDLDFVFLRSFHNDTKNSNLKNFVASCDLNSDPGTDRNSKHNRGKLIANGLFHNDAGHFFLETAMNVFDETFVNGIHLSSGPMVFTAALKKLCDPEYGNNTPFVPVDYSRNRCSGIELFEPWLFYPVDWFHSTILNKNHMLVDSYWEEKFKNSVAVHFYGSLVRNDNDKVMRPKNYGKKKPAMAYIGPKACPLSFFSTTPF